MNTSYALTSDIEKRYTEEILVILTNDFNDGSEGWDYSVILNPNLMAASSEIDSYLSKRYRVPLKMVPDMIKSFCIDIALSITAPDADGHAKLIQERANYAREHLQKIADGKLNLPLDKDGDGAVNDGELGSNNPDIRTTKIKQVFTAEKMEKY